MPTAFRDPIGEKMLGRGMPSWLVEILQQVAVNPTTTILPAGKLVEMLGSILTPATKAKGGRGLLPKRLKLTSLDPDAGKAVLHGGKGFEQFDSSIDEMRRLMGEGHLVPEGPPERTVAQGKAALTKVLRRKPDMDAGMKTVAKAADKPRRDPALDEELRSMSDEQYRRYMKKFFGQE